MPVHQADLTSWNFHPSREELHDTLIGQIAFRRLPYGYQEMILRLLDDGFLLGTGGHPDADIHDSSIAHLSARTPCLPRGFAFRGFFATMGNVLFGRKEKAKDIPGYPPAGGGRAVALYYRVCLQSMQFLIKIQTKYTSDILRILRKE